MENGVLQLECCGQVEDKKFAYELLYLDFMRMSE